MMRLKTTKTVKHIFAELGILTVYGLFTFETINYVKQFNNARLLKRKKNYNTCCNKRVEMHNL